MTEGHTPGLIERIEAATGPDRELDREIMLAVGYRYEERDIGCRYDDGSVALDWVYVDSQTDKWRSTHPLEFTSSIDAAMTLVPEGAGLSIQRYWIAAVDGPVWSAGISTGGIPSNPRQVFECYDAAHAALAITAASLKARSILSRAQQGGGEK